MKERTRIILILLISVFILAVETLLVYKGVSSGHTIKQVNDTTRIAGYFAAFTVDCECFMAMISLAGVILCTKVLIRKENVLPEWFDIIYLVGTSSLTLVFLVVACYLAPIKAAHGYSYFYLFSKGNFYNHFLHPLLSVLCLNIINNMRELPRWLALLAPVPATIYAFVYVTNVAILKTWPDLYGFFAGGHYWYLPIGVIVMIAITYGLGRLHIRLHNKSCHNRTEDMLRNVN